MLFVYQYVDHPIERFQEYLDHLVKEVWCKAAADFSLDLLHTDLRDIVLEIYNTEEDTTRGNAGDWLHGPIQKIYNLFKDFDLPQRQQISDWYDHNNDIEALCAHDLLKSPATYDDLRTVSADLATDLKKFCESLFTNVIHLKAVRSRIGEIDEHYEAFVARNKAGKCPYCGYSDIKGVHNTKREAYDHFLPKDKYPFSTVNFHNLAPMCNECNSSYKLAKDPTWNIDPIKGRGGTRRRAFYTYAAVAPSIKISLTLKTRDVQNLQRDEIDIEFAAPGCEEEVEAWKDVFGIEERYKAKLCAENDGMAWLQQLVEEAANGEMTSDQLLAMELRRAARYPYSDANFIKGPFLIACRDAKII